MKQTFEGKIYHVSPSGQEDMVAGACSRQKSNCLDCSRIRKMKPDAQLSYSHFLYYLFVFSFFFTESGTSTLMMMIKSFWCLSPVS